MRDLATAKLLKWGCCTQSMSHNGFGIDLGYPSLPPNANKPHSTAERAKKGYVNMGKVIAQITCANAHRLTTYLYKAYTQAFSACPVVYLCF